MKDNKGILTGVIFFVMWMFTFMVILPMIGYAVKPPELDNASIGQTIIYIITTPAYLMYVAIGLVISMIIAMILTVILVRLFKRGVGER
jgi:hypothetical protein